VAALTSIIDRTSQVSLERLVGLLQPDLAAVLLVEAVCAPESLATHLRIYGSPPGYSAIPKLLADRWRESLLWLRTRIRAALPAQEKE
jgi:hypothetical protein